MFIPHKQELDTIAAFYGDKRAERSQEPLMFHILQGLSVLDNINASDNAKRAFCLHPIVQNDQEDVMSVSWSEAYELAKEYRDRANSYLCRPDTDWVKTVDDVYKVVGTMSKDCADMLLADKVQNRASFNMHHKETHARSKELAAYFDLWIDYIFSMKWEDK